MAPVVYRIDAAGAVDGLGNRHANCSLLLQINPVNWPALELLAIGSPEEVSSHPAASSLPDTQRMRLPDDVAIPGLVNAHSHLDLSHIGSQPFDPARGFVGWVEFIQSRRCQTDHETAASVRSGIELTLAGGVVAVGDVAGVWGTAAYEALAGSCLRGVSGIEVFGLGCRQAKVTARIQELGAMLDASDSHARGVRWTWQPHAPYSAGLDVYEACARSCLEHGRPLLTHLAETPEERRFVARGDGPQADLLKRMGIWDESCLDGLAEGRTPVEYLMGVLESVPCIIAHANDASDRDIELLATTRTTVAYCPRASSYFRQDDAFGPHRYQEMLDAGINVGLGTDSIVNIPELESDRLSTLDEARLLVRRDRLDAEVAMGMATWRAGLPLGLDRDGFSFSREGLPRKLHGLSLVRVGGSKAGDGLAQRVMTSEHLPRLVRPTA
jgi:cytosine/adenosine deaminase-related metal-dependent hydrolase